MIVSVRFPIPKPISFIICFDIKRLQTLDSVGGKWVHELRDHCPGVKGILVGTGMDGGVGGGDDGVKEGKEWARRGGEVLCEQGLEMARRIGKGVGYLECDAREGGVGEKILDLVSVGDMGIGGEGG